MTQRNNQRIWIYHHEMIIQFFEYEFYQKPMNSSKTWASSTISWYNISLWISYYHETNIETSIMENIIKYWREYIEWVDEEYIAICEDIA